MYVRFWNFNFVILLSLGDTRGDRMYGNEIKQRTLTSRAFISIAMHPAICSYDEQAFGKMCEESERKKKLS